METVVGLFSIVTAVATVTYVYLTHRLIKEVAEDRLTRDRPFVYVDFTERREEGGSPGANLRIRNEGRSPATNVHLSFDGEVRGRNGDDVLANPVLREGLAFLAPGHAMSIALYERFLLGRMLHASPVLVPGDEPPPRRPLRVACTVRYRDGITGRDYEETFVADLDARQHGWVLSEV